MAQTICKICKKQFDRDQVKDEHKNLFILADRSGMEALTEAGQALIEGSICSECYYRTN